MNKKKRKKVLFICTNNSARSQMAEGLLRHVYGNEYAVYSAGTNPTRIHPKAVMVMKEIGIDISGQKAKNISIYKEKRFDYVITVCDKAREACPFFPGGEKIIHKSFEDPANNNNHDSEIYSLMKFRKVRNSISLWIQTYFHPEL
jgi:arsenate reductase